jgi:hypothetical protein
MMLDLANSGTLYPKQLDLIDNWLHGWHSKLRLTRRLDAEAHNFSVDLSADHGPRRVRKPDADRPMRFWGTSDLLAQLDRLQQSLHEGRSPAELGLTENARTTESLELLEHLRHHWSSLTDREQRRAPRATVKRLLDITHGLGAIIGQLKAVDTPVHVSPYGAGLNYSETDDVQVYGFITDRTRERVSHMQMPAAPHPDVERWVMNDESECGYGAIVESSDKDWLRVGALISVKSHEATSWKLGIIRRLSRLNDDTSSVGIETLAETPSLVTLYDTSSSGYTVDGTDNTRNTLPNPGLWLVNDKGAISMIIDPVHFMPGKVYEIHGVPDYQFIALGTPIERSEGWMRVQAEPVSS